MANVLLAALSCLLLAFIMYWYFKCTKTRRQINKWSHHLNINEHALVFQRLYQHSNGFLLSKAARKGQEDALEYTYGEIQFHSFIALLSLAKPDRQTVFYDLGSGTGKAVLACAMVYPVQHSVGIELFPELYFCACERRTELAHQAGYKKQAAAISFIQGNFLTTDLADATLIFINSSALFGTAWDELCQRLTHLPQLNAVITMSKPLKTPGFILTIRTQVEMSWGIASAFVHFKKQIATKPIENIE